MDDKALRDHVLYLLRGGGTHLSFDDAIADLPDELRGANGPTGTVLTNLAKVYSARRDDQQADAVLWEALTLDPNQDNALMWWAALHRERHGEQALWAALKKVSEIEQSWRSQLWLARRCLEQKDLLHALEYYQHVLKLAADAPDVLMMISGDLGNHGHVEEILRLVLPVYDPARHDIGAGMNILQAYLQAGNYADGEILLHQLFALNRPDIRDHLKYYSDEFDKLKDSELGRRNASSEIPEKIPQIEVVRLDRPIWSYGLSNPEWLFRSEAARDRTIALIVLANTTASNLSKPTLQQEDDLGRMTRSIPLYFAESLLFWTDLTPVVLVPTVVFGGPVVIGTEWTADQIFDLTGGTAERAVAGTLNRTENGITITLSVWNCTIPEEQERFERTATEDALGEAISSLEQELLTSVAEDDTRTVPREAYYSRPCAPLLMPYLTCLGQSLTMTFAQNGVISANRLWGERNMFDCFLELALRMPDAQVPRILLTAALAKSRSYGSAVYAEYKSKVLLLLKHEKSSTSEFYRLSPLLFQTFDMRDEFERRIADLRTADDDLYRQWLDRLIDEASEC